MNIFNKITLEHMKKSRSRTMITIIGVILSAAMITAVATFGSSLLKFLVDGSIDRYGSWHVEFLETDYSFFQDRIYDDGVTNVFSFENLGYAKLEGGRNSEKPYLFIAGFSDETFKNLPLKLISGRLPENNNEILIPEHIAITGGVRFKVGDKLSLDIGSLSDDKKTVLPAEKKTYTVTGIFERPGFEEHSSPAYTVITKVGIKSGTVERSYKNDLKKFSVFVTLKNPHKVKSYSNNAAQNNRYIFNDNVLRFMGGSENKVFNTFLYTIATTLLSIIMIGSVFLIYNAFNISLNERTRQFGILSSIGATSKQLRNSVFFEGLCIGVIGIPTGIIVGITSVWILIPVIAKNFVSIIHSNIPLKLYVSISAIAMASIISLVTILISAYIPAKRAEKTPIMENIRQNNEVKIESSFGIKALKSSKLVEQIYGLEGSLALKNFKRNKKSYRSIVLSLVLSILLFVSGSTFSTTLKELSEKSLIDIDYDILFSAENLSDSEIIPLYDKLKTADEVYESSYQKVLEYECKANIRDFSDSYLKSSGYSDLDKTISLPMDIQFMKEDEYFRFIIELGLSSEEYRGENAKFIAVAKKRIINEDGKSEIMDMFSKPSMTFVVAPKINENINLEKFQSIDITFVDTYSLDPPPKSYLESENNPDVFMVIAPYSLKEKFEIDNISSYTGMAFRSNNPLKSISEIGNIIIEEEFGSKYSLYNIHDMLEQYRSITFIIDVFTYVFVVMISLIAVANVFNTISTNIRLRRRELAMIRSVGMSDRDFTKMMNFECVFYGIRTLLVGLPISVIVSWFIYKGLTFAEKIDNLQFIFPWKSMAISILGVLIIVFITMLYATSKLKKENIIEALRDDMI
ncbi:MAG: ABC transporter permease [Proteocatella sp.]